MTKTTTTIALAAVTALALGCDKKDEPAAAGSSGQAAAPTSGAAATGEPRATSAAIDELLGAVPGDALGVAFVDLPATPWSLVTGGMIPLEADEQAALEQELKDYVGKRFGIDVSKAQYAVGFVAGPPPRGAILIKSLSGAALAEGEDYKGGKLRRIDDEASLAARGDVVIVGVDGAVRAVLETMAGERPSVVKEQAELVDWLKGQSQGAYVALAGKVPAGVPLPPPFTGLKRGAIAIGGGRVHAAVEGDDATLNALEMQLKGFVAMVTAEVEKERQRALAGDGDPAEGVGVILASHYTRSMAKKLAPVRTGDQLALDVAFDFGGAQMYVAMIGIAAAVAIPAFHGYIEKSKAAALPPTTPFDGAGADAPPTDPFAR